MSDTPNTTGKTLLPAPDITVSVRDVFGIDIDMECPAFSVADERVPDFDPSYVFDPDTTLAIIAGLLAPRTGRVQVGEEVWLDTAAGLERPVHLRRLAFVFQTLALFPHRTVGQNIEAQIQTHKDEIVRLEGIRSKLSNGATLLDLSINDLQSAMRY